MSLSKQSPTISDLPVDVISLVFEHLPLSEVLLKQSLVCKVFYQAHRQHCRSSVKHLTLLGHFMVNTNKYVRKNPVVIPQSETDLKLALFSIARSTGNSSCRVINSSTVHLKLVAGREEAAYDIIGRKFKSITHLELCQLPLERTYKQIVKMIAAWNSEDKTNQLTDLKIFFNKEIFDVDGIALTSGRRSNKNRCFAYIFGEALTPAVAPALRRVTLERANLKAAEMFGCDHNGYSGPHVKKVDLSALESINALDFSVCKVPVKRGVDENYRTIFLPPPPNLQDLTIRLEDYEGWNTEPTAFSHFRRLHSLTVYYNHAHEDICKHLVGAGDQLKSLTLKEVSRPFTDLLQKFIAPFTTTKASGVNRSLEHLRVDFKVRYYIVETAGLNVRFQALVSLHMVKTEMLHRKEELHSLSALFPNLVHLRLDGNYDARCFREVKTGRNTVRKPRKFLNDCFSCREHTCSVVEHPLGRRRRGVPSDDIQFIESSTAETCKDAFVRRAMTVWPKLAKISLQIEDFHEHGLENGVDLKYLYLSESLILRDSSTGEALPEAERVWTVEKVPY